MYPSKQKSLSANTRARSCESATVVVSVFVAVDDVGGVAVADAVDWAVLGIEVGAVEGVVVGVFVEGVDAAGVVVLGGFVDVALVPSALLLPAAVVVAGDALGPALGADLALRRSFPFVTVAALADGSAVALAVAVAAVVATGGGEMGPVDSLVLARLAAWPCCDE